MLGIGLSLTSSASATAVLSQVPTLDLNFLTGSMPSGITFTRASTGWAYNSSGVLTSYATNAPRLDYDPVALTAKGLLIEEARTNLVPGTMTGGWTPLNVGIAAGGAAPTGGADAFTLTGSASGTTNYGANLTAPVTVTASTATTASVFVKAGTAAWFRLILADATTPTIGAQCYFQPSTGTVGTVGTQSGAPTGVSAVSQSVGGGWYRISLTATLGTSTAATMLLRMTSANGTLTDTGSNTVLLFNPQLEVGATASSPILTTTAAATRAADVTVINPLGSWFNATEGTFFVDATTLAATGISVVGGVTDGTFDNTIYGTLIQSSNSWFVRTGNVQQAALTGSGTVTGGTAKMALAYAASDFAASCNGGTVLTDTSGTVPTVTLMKIGLAPWGSGGNYLNGCMRRVRYYRNRLSNATLQSITAS